MEEEKPFFLKGTIWQYGVFVKIKQLAKICVCECWWGGVSLVKKEWPNKRHMKMFFKTLVTRKNHHVWGELLKLSRSHMIFQQLSTFTDE